MNDSPEAELRKAKDELARVQDELQSARVELARAREAHAEFVARLGHDLRAQLGTIFGFSELLGASTHDTADSVQHILDAGRRLREILDGSALPPVAPDQGRPPERRSAPRADDASLVLYIEDNLPSVRLVERILAGRPRTLLRTAGTAGEGLAAAGREAPDLILLDLNLPDMHGAEVLARLREQPATARVPVVVITADATPSQIDRLLAAGARDYLTKPFDPVRLGYLIDEILAPPSGDLSGEAG